MKDYVLVIPARYKSTRLPGKPLIDLNGKSMLLRTYERCNMAVESDIIYVATDDYKIYEHCKLNNINVVMTSEGCLTGTDRVAEFSKKVLAKTYINVQGDEPLMNPNDIEEVIKAIKLYPKDVINGFTKIETEEQYRSKTIPKVVFRPDGRLLYMSRSPIPGNKSNKFNKSWRQICIYAFPYEILNEFSKIQSKTILENEEDIEILRFLEMGYDVRMIELSTDSIAVDTADDAQKVRQYLKKM
jgi:3-deoxy-manno-octulosonate cytidylyltransferase (CMP-KDO synthetase)